MAQGAWYRFWQPELGWLNEANMTNYRSLNAMRISVAIIAIGVLAFGGSVFMFWRSTWMAGGYLEATSVSAVLMSGKEAAGFAKDILEAMLWFAAAIGGFAVGGAAIKRATDTDHQVAVRMAQAEVEKAKKAPVVIPPPLVTQEHAAPPTQQMTVNVGEEPKPPEGVREVKQPLRQEPTGNALTDDESGS
jgi:hypothetical protein